MSRYRIINRHDLVDHKPDEVVTYSIPIEEVWAKYGMPGEFKSKPHSPYTNNLGKRDTGLEVYHEV